MSNYNPPTGPPPNWSDSKGQTNNNNASAGGQGETSRGYAPPLQPQYQQQGYGGYQQGGQQGGYYQQQGPPQGGYYQQQGQQQGGYYQQQPQQQYYVQQKKSGGGSEGCLMGCLAAMCLCCTLDAIF